MCLQHVLYITLCCLKYLQTGIRSQWHWWLHWCQAMWQLGSVLQHLRHHVVHSCCHRCSCCWCPICHRCLENSNKLWHKLLWHRPVLWCVPFSYCSNLVNLCCHVWRTVDTLHILLQEAPYPYYWIMLSILQCHTNFSWQVSCNWLLCNN